ncbi:MAG: alkaline phosphatase family protein, partial [Chloroflexota bacterium]
MTSYADDLPTKVMFPDQNISMTLAETLSKAGKTQLHAAETEKYPHVTFFFNGGEEPPFEGESRIIAESPKVATYDLKPEMSAYELTEKVMAHISVEQPDFVLVNFANPDMVGHTGSLEAAIKAVETVDDCVGKIVEQISAMGGATLLTADHGNCERMVELLTGDPHTYHTTNPVNCLIISQDYYLLRPRGILADVAPTILDLMDVAQPPEMTGESLLVRL